MFSSIILFLILSVLLVFPVMYADRLVDAERTGFGAALIAVIGQLVLSVLVSAIAPTQFVGVLIGVVGGSAIYAFTLGTSLLKGFIISIVALVVGIIALFVLLGSFAIFSNVI